MEQVGKILSVDDGMATLEVKRVSACGTSCQSCHAGCEEKSEIVTMVNELHGEVGDYVEIGMDNRFVLFSMIKIYGIPLLLFLISVVISLQFFDHGSETGQLYSFLIGILSFVISFFILKRLDQNTNHTRFMMIRIL